MFQRIAWINPCSESSGKLDVALHEVQGLQSFSVKGDLQTQQQAVYTLPHHECIIILLKAMVASRRTAMVLAATAIRFVDFTHRPARRLNLNAECEDMSLRDPVTWMPTKSAYSLIQPFGLAIQRLCGCHLFLWSASLFRTENRIYNIFIIRPAVSFFYRRMRSVALYFADLWPFWNLWLFAIPWFHFLCWLRPSVFRDASRSVSRFRPWTYSCRQYSVGFNREPISQKPGYWVHNQKSDELSHCCQWPSRGRKVYRSRREVYGSTDCPTNATQATAWSKHSRAFLWFVLCSQSHGFQHRPRNRRRP